MPFLFWLFMTPSGIAVLALLIAGGPIALAIQIRRERLQQRRKRMPEFKLELPRPRPRVRPDITSN